MAENIEHHCLNNDFQLIYKNSHDDSFLLINTLDYNCNRNEKKKKKRISPQGPELRGQLQTFNPIGDSAGGPWKLLRHQSLLSRMCGEEVDALITRRGKNIDLHLKEFSFITSRPGLGSAPDVHENTVTQRQRDRRDWYRWILLRVGEKM